VIRQKIGLTRDFNPHAPGRARDNAKRSFFGVGVEVLHFEFNDFENLFASDFADFILVGLFGSCRDSSSFLEQD
jgi:hypothetical protein